ncbi:MFS transporter [Georgenia faecalis]|uniref:MFS transporter n=1 Tax=Georgenia faecalis TaxID=2483799 RepID=UPI000FD7EE46|nr:MFS transporter [Georgenia faecalis]
MDQAGATPSSPAAEATAPRRGLGPAFRNLFVANLSSSLGDGIARTATPLLAARLTDDPLLISGVAALAMLPWLFFAIPAGILVDRIDRRRALALASAVRTVLAVGLLALAATDSLTIEWLFAVVFLYGVFETVYDGAIRAILPGVVDRPNLPRANSRIEAGELITQNFLAGPVTSTLFAVSVLIPLGGLAGAYAVAVVLAFFLPAAAAGKRQARRRAAADRAASAPQGATTPADDGASGPATATTTASAGRPVTREDPDDDAPDEPWYRQLLDGLRFILANRMLRTLWFLSTFTALCFSAAIATYVLFVLEELAVPEAWFGAFMVTAVVGGLAGTALTSRAKAALGTGGAMAVANLVAALMLTLMGVFPTIAVAAVTFAVANAAVIVWNVLVMSLRQSLIPDHLLGRVHGTWRTLLWGVTPLGSLLGGLLARVDLTTPLVVGGALSAVVGLVWFRFLRSLPNPEDVEELGG